MEQVTKKRIMAIVGIVLPILLTIVAGNIENESWAVEIIALCGLFIYPLFYYTVLLIEGLKNKFKAITIFTIIGLVLCVFCLISFIFTGGIGPNTDTSQISSITMLLHVLFLIVFSIVLLIKTFKKSK